MTELQINFKCPDIGINGVHRGKKVEKKYLNNVLKCNKNYKPTDVTNTHNKYQTHFKKKII